MVVVATGQAASLLANTRQSFELKLTCPICGASVGQDPASHLLEELLFWCSSRKSKLFKHLTFTTDTYTRSRETFFYRQARSGSLTRKRLDWHNVTKRGAGPQRNKLRPSQVAKVRLDGVRARWLGAANDETA